MASLLRRPLLGRLLWTHRLQPGSGQCEPRGVGSGAWGMAGAAAPGAAWEGADPLAIPPEGYRTGIPFLWEPCACRYGLRCLSSRPGDACGSGQGTARQVFPHAVQGIPAATLLLCSPPHPLCLVVVGCWSDTGPRSVYTSISAVPSGPAPTPGPAGQVFRCFHTAPAGAFLPPGRGVAL